jgi:uncharacterized protein (TIGR02270 family)
VTIPVTNPLPTPLARPAAAGSTSSAGAPTAKLSYIPEILEEHYEELQFLWSIRRTAIRSPSFTLGDIAKFETRIEAHLQGMLVVGERMRDLVEPGLTGDDATIVFASAFALLRLDRPATTRLVLNHFAGATGPALDGLREALCHAAPSGALHELESLSRTLNPVNATAALEVLVWRALKPPAIERIRPFLASESPAARQAAWRILALLGSPADAKDYSAAMRDDDPLVRTEATWSAAWARVPGILALARRYAESPAQEHLELFRLLAALGTREDLPRIERLANDETLGPPAIRLPLVGVFGHLTFANDLITKMSNGNPEVAVAAAEAFRVMTGTDVSSDKMAKLPPASPTGDPALDAEFADDVRLPDPERARAIWSAMKDRRVNAERICHGQDISRGATVEQLSTFDLASRWYVAARNRFYGVGGPSLIDLGRFVVERSRQ